MFGDDIKRLLRILTIPVILVGCDADIPAMQTGYSFGSFVDLTCGLAELSKSQYERFFKDLPLSERREIEVQMALESSQCEELSNVLNSVAASHAQLAEGYLLPKKVYFFRFEATTDQDIRTVGLYEDQEFCVVAQEALSNVGYEVSDCLPGVVISRYVWAI